MEIANQKINQYINEVTTLSMSAHSVEIPDDAVKFWKNRMLSYGNLAHVACNIVSAPASQAYVERIFSISGLLSSGRRNRMSKFLTTRVFLKLNANVLKLA